MTLGVHNGGTARSNAATLYFYVTFSRDVAGVSSNSFAITTTTGGTVRTPTGSGGGYTVPVQGMTSQGTVTLALKTSGHNIVSVLGSYPLVAPFGNSSTITWGERVASMSQLASCVELSLSDPPRHWWLARTDTVRPSISSVSRSSSALFVPAGATITFTVTYSEPVLYVSLNDFLPAGSAAADLTLDSRTPISPLANGAATAFSVSVLVSPAAASGTVAQLQAVVNGAGTSVQDQAGNTPLQGSAVTSANGPTVGTRSLVLLWLFESC